VQAEMGMPPPSDLAEVSRSGMTSHCSMVIARDQGHQISEAIILLGPQKVFRVGERKERIAYTSIYLRQLQAFA